MVNIRNLNEIILNLIDYYKLAQPDLDTKEGSVAKDLFIDGPSSQLSILYDQLSLVSTQQSLRLLNGQDLDNYAKNFGISRKQATTSSGTALLSFSSLNAPISINKGDLVYSSNGYSFSVVNGTTVAVESANFYKSVAAKFRNDLDFNGITDIYAVQVTVQSTSPGTSANIGKYALNRTSIPGISNVTNTNPYTNATNQESDAFFRDRILSAFSGASIGTALGYKSTALSTEGVSDALVIEPGDPLMTRDGTVTQVNSDGTIDILSEGTGGKVDIIILGSSLQENKDSFIYKDKSNSNDPTSYKNDFVIGQIADDAGKTVNKKRRDDIATGSLPIQPVQDISAVTGSLSGSNFKAKSIDAYGRVSGNYELVKDTGIYAGSPWGFDTFKWVSNKIQDFQEDRVKGQLNGQDNLTFTDPTELPKITQNIAITNENSVVTSDKSIIQLTHYPCTSVTRVFNVNTGERYFISSQNPDGTGSTNLTGRIKISGNTLPSTNDVLQVDYSWIVTYDQYSDYDGLINTQNLRNVDNSVDWGYSSLVREEYINFVQDASLTFYNGTAKHQISTVISAKEYFESTGTIYKITSGIYINRFAVDISNLSISTTSVNSVKLKNSNTEVYSTSENNGLFTNTSVIVGLDLYYTTTIILPTDTVVIVGDKVSVHLNESDIFALSSSLGTSNGNVITIPASNFSKTATNIKLKVSYIANVSELNNFTINSFPISRSGNGFLSNQVSTSLNNKFFNTLKKENLSVQKNLSNQYYVDLSISSLDTVLDASKVLSIVRIVDGKELWNFYSPGTVTTTVSTNYELILSGLNSPVEGDKVFVFYSSDDIRKFQPFTYQNNYIRTRIDSVLKDFSLNKFYVKLNNFVDETNLSCEILDNTSNEVIASFTDGYTSAASNGSSASLGSTSFLFSSIQDFASKTIKISNATNPDNNGIFEIDASNVSSNLVTISNDLQNISKNQLMVIRLLDGKDLWVDECSIDIDNNLLYLPATSAINPGDKVYIVAFDYDILKHAPTKLSINLSDQIVNPGTISIIGDSVVKAENIVFTATGTGLKQSINEVVRSALNLSSVTAIPSNVKLVKISKLEKVTTISSSSNEVLTVLNEYDLKNTKLRTASLYPDDFIEDLTLSSLEFTLPNTTNNSSNSADLANLPKVGDRLRTTLYILIENDSETMTFTRNGNLYTNKSFAFINKINVISGFKSSQSSTFTVNNFNQPTLGARYNVTYDYIAPKQNERIVITYDYNKLITDVTFNVEASRPINADVLVKASTEVLLDVTMNVVIASDFLNSQTIVVQNLKDALINSLNANKLGTTIDSSDLINTAYTVQGIDRARIIYFNKNGSSGQVLSVVAQKNEYFAANNVIVNVETR